MRTAMLLLTVILAAGVARATEKDKPFVQPGPTGLRNLDCSNAIPITCGESVTGTTVGQPNNVDYYSCAGWYEPGGEVVYELLLTDCYRLTVSLSDTTGDPDVFVLESCDEDDCLAYGDDSVVTQCLWWRTYYVVVDGYHSAPDCTYTLTVECEPCECPQPPCCPFPHVCQSLDFNVGQGNLVVLPCGGEPVWEWGEAIWAPGIACDGVPVTNALATDLDDDYPHLAGEIAMVGPFVITETCWCLELCHYYDIEAGFDGGNVKISTDAGATWELLWPARGYDRLAYAAPNCIAGEWVFSGRQFSGGFIRDCFYMRDYIGETVWFGFFFGSDASIEYPGWVVKWIKTGSYWYSPVEDASWGLIKSLYR
jgi:hypothetical protein